MYFTKNLCDDENDICLICIVNLLGNIFPYLGWQLVHIAGWFDSYSLQYILDRVLYHEVRTAGQAEMQLRSF